MVLQEMEEVREKLNKLLEQYDCNSKEVLELSRKMDILITRFILDKEVVKKSKL